MIAFPHPVKEAVFIAGQAATASGEGEPCLALVRHKEAGRPRTATNRRLTLPERVRGGGKRFALADDIAGRVAGFKAGDCRLCRFPFPQNIG